MENSYLVLFSFLLSNNKRNQLRFLVDNMGLQHPYDKVWKELKTINTNISKLEYLEIVKDVLDTEDYLYFKEMPESVSNTIGYRAVQKLVNLNKLNKINRILTEDFEPALKLERIKKLIEQSNSIGNSKSKLISEINIEEQKNQFYIFDYGVAQEELVVLCAFTGRGKTSLMLTFLKEALLNKLKVLYISIKDFSEVMFAQRIISSGEFPDFKVSCYSSLDVPSLEIEIDEQEPDIVFVDYLSVMDATGKTDTRRFELENITSNLKRLAQEKQVILVTAHQLNKDNPFPKADDLLEAKAGIVSHADLVLGIGGDIQSEIRNVTTIKSRRQKPLPDFSIKVNFDNLTYDYNMEEINAQI